MPTKDDDAKKPASAAPEGVEVPAAPAKVAIRKRSQYSATTLTFADGAPFVGLTAEVSPEEAERLVALGICEKV